MPRIFGGGFTVVARRRLAAAGAPAVRALAGPQTEQQDQGRVLHGRIKHQPYRPLATAFDSAPSNAAGSV